MMCPWFVDKIQVTTHDGQTYVYNSDNDSWSCTSQQNTGISLSSIFSFIGVVTTLGTVAYSGIKYITNKNEFWLISTRRKLLERGFTESDLNYLIPLDSQVFLSLKMEIIDYIVSERIKIENSQNLLRPADFEWFFSSCNEYKQVRSQKGMFGTELRIFNDLLAIRGKLLENPGADNLAIQIEGEKHEDAHA